jgi:hypothetical protein
MISAVPKENQMPVMFDKINLAPVARVCGMKG